MALPPLVVTGQIVAAGHINAIRNWLTAWGAPVAAGNNDLTGVASLTCTNLTVTGTATLPVASASTTITTTLTLPTPLDSAIAGFSVRTTDGGNAIRHEQTLYRFNTAPGANTMETRMARYVDNTAGPFVSLGNDAVVGSYVGLGSGLTRYFRFSRGTLRIQPKSPGGTEGGIIELPDADNVLHYQIFNDNRKFRINRPGSPNSNNGIAMNELGYTSIGSGNFQPSRPLTIEAGGGYDWANFTSAGDSVLAMVNQGGGGAFGLFMSHSITGARHAWIQCSLAGTSHHPLLLNPLGGQVVLYAAATIDDTMIPKNCITFQFDETNNLLRVRAKYNNGTTLKSGFIALT
jgi:hypothetical protein